MKERLRRSIALLLCVLCVSPSALWAAPGAPEATAPSEAAPAPASAPVPAAQAKALAHLSTLEGWEALKPFAELKKPTADDATEALAAAFQAVTQAAPASWSEAGYRQADAEAFLNLVQSRKDALRARGLSAWTYERKVQKLVAAYGTAKASTPSASGTPTVVPSAGAGDAEVRSLREKVTALEGQLERAKSAAASAQARADQAVSQAVQAEDRAGEAKDAAGKVQAQADRLRSEAELRAQAAADMEKARAADREAQKEEARLLKKLVDDLQTGQQRLETSLAEVDKKTDRKELDEEELRQSLTIMRKDLRDNVEDTSVLKQKVEKLMAPEKTYARPLDKALSSKWLPGAAVLLALGAIVIAASK